MNDPATPAASDWHLREADDVARTHAVELHRGLHDEEAARRAVLHGPNELVERARRSPWKLLLEQFTDFMILVLIGAAVLAGALGDLVDTLAILVIVVLNGLVGFVQAWRADRALAALKRLAAAHATVLRDGKLRRVSANALVPGDIRRDLLDLP
jgi:Ca2+-transporting ATPase